MTRFAIPVAVTMIAPSAAALAQAAPPPAPPLPRAPVAGMIKCDVRSQSGAESHFEGVLGLSEPRAEGKRYPQVSLQSPETPEFTGTFDAQWDTDGAKFLNVSDDGKTIIVMRYLGSTFMTGDGAIAIEVKSTLGGPKTFHAGYCQTSFSNRGVVQ